MNNLINIKQAMEAAMDDYNAAKLGIVKQTGSNDNPKKAAQKQGSSLLNQHQWVSISDSLKDINQ